MIISHIHLKVKDIQASSEFYKNMFEMEVVETDNSKFAFLALTGSKQHHVIALQSHQNGLPPKKADLGLFHFAFVVLTLKEFVDYLEKLKKLKATYKLVDQGVCWSIYLDDLDGNGLEVFLDIRNEPYGRKVWNLHSDQLDERTIYSHFNAYH